VSEDDTRIARPTARYLRPDITPGEFEKFVAGTLLGAAEVDDLVITVHEKVAGVDGTYDFDATVRYRFAGMDFLVVVEAKLHRNPIKRELVQVLAQKLRGVGAHKGVMVSTAPFQSGALEFASVHGIALVTVTEGRFVFETRDASPMSHASDDGLPGLVAHRYGPGSKPGWTSVHLLSPDDDEFPGDVAELLLVRPPR
jgi:hypothetical protein